MWEVLMKIWFAIAILPVLVFHEGYTRLNKYLEKRGLRKVDRFEVTLVGLILLLLILYSVGFRW